ncbi:ParB N-terminal domain-containing protein [Xylanimonas ulmi]|uniref:ParB family chromosome partitioning protein n=1 Tax=Xylanimonas ulmi TaxID=228973 RepID=A0A4Q7M1K0_9MICO|nr:ParB N-terminal domain-containing protein [Xylanibacterium ulmi]RZS60667.1 ParB family chromosome partitioning protein [Xylanibacterium ulmi]
MTDHGHLDTERAIDSIRVGTRHRNDLGDIDALAASINDLGLLQPITISPDGLLICGRRRLEAVRRLGRSTIRVTVRSGLSDELHLLLAEREENAQRKPLSPIEASKLYEELRALIDDDGRRRRAATQFGANKTDKHGFAQWAKPQTAPSLGAGERPWDSRRQAAEQVTGSASYSNHEATAKLRHLAEDESQPEEIRQMAIAELARVEAGAASRAAYNRVADAIKNLTATPDPQPTARPRLKVVPSSDDPSTPRPVSRRPTTTQQSPQEPEAAPKRSTHAFVATFHDLVGSEGQYDVDQLASELTATELDEFLAVCVEIEHIREALVSRRTARPTNPKSA